MGEKATDGDLEDLPLQRFVTYRIARVQAKLNAQAASLLREAAGLTLSQWRVLALVGAEGRTRLSELARIAALDKGLLSRNLKVLVADGLIEAEQDARDHRVQHLSLTAPGRALFERALPVMRARQRRLHAALTPSELETLHRALDKLEIAVTDEEAP